ncbi:MAG: 2-oxo-4-hydroxy-4-carboxy-5-ureidoimidazoline decarboxylase [Cyanobacteria bacterium J06606_4]
MLLSIEVINQMTQAEFVQQFGPVFEETPMVAERAWAGRPFADALDLHRKMVAVVMEHMTPSEQRTLICAHPELGAKGKMAAASVQEQASSGLSQLNDEDYRRLQRLNAAYREKFGFPFVIAVKGKTVSDVFAAIELRLGSADVVEERVRSLTEICKIARFRLESLILQQPSQNGA